MKKRILSAVLTLCLCISSHSAAYAAQEVPLQQKDALTTESTTKSDVKIPTPTEVYEAMIALKEQEAYKEGTPWTNDEPYSDAKGYYRWKGGPLDGKNISAVGCVAFAFILSDAAFDSLPARMYATGQFQFEDIKAGDILRVNNDVHTVIVLEAAEDAVVLAEGNISAGDHKGKVHWGRTMSKEEVMNSASHYITRYPEDYVSPDDPTANDIVDEGTLDGGLTWKLTKAGTLTISGKGAMPDFSGPADEPWSNSGSQSRNSVNKIRKVVIEEGVTSIGSCAFWNCEVLSAQISSTVTTIGNSAFRNSSIVSVTIPSNVTIIGDSAFQDCKNLSSVSISEGVEKISQNAFRACQSLASIALPASIGEVGAAAFFQCQKMTSATFAPGNKQVTLGDNMFTQCYYLMSVTLPKNIDCIPTGMFQNCLMLPGLEIPQGAESIGESAFASCSALSVLIIPDSVGRIERSAFSACPLSDIYFTGTEEQWKAISKIPVLSDLEKVKITYNYIPPSEPDGDDNNNDNPGGDNTPGGDNSGSGNTPGGGDNSGSGSTPGGGDNSGSGSTPGGGNNSGSTNNSGSNNSENVDKPENNADISNAAITLAETDYIYDGTAKTPSVTVELDGKTLVLNTDYTVSYSNNVNPGTATVTIIGMGNYTGSNTASFTITKEPDIICDKTVYKVTYGAKPFQINASSEAKLTFTSSNPKIVAVDKNTGTATIKGTGTATITIKAEKLSKKVTVKVNPKKPSVKSVKTASGKKLAIAWAKDKMSSGYQVQISTDKSFKKNIKSKNTTKTSYTFTKLKTGKKYYVRIRSYKKSGGETLYSSWSNVKLSGKVKK